jgi:hypothetical protein
MQQLTPIQKRRAVRYGALAVVIVAGLAFHGSGSSYTAIRGLYFLVIIGLLVSRSRSGAGRGGMYRGSGGMYGGWGGNRGMGPMNGSQGAPGTGPVGVPPMNQVGAPGWVADGTDPTVQRYWDGIAWTKQRRWNGQNWDEHA